MKQNRKNHRGRGDRGSHGNYKSASFKNDNDFQINQSLLFSANKFLQKEYKIMERLITFLFLNL